MMPCASRNNYTHRGRQTVATKRKVEEALAAAMILCALADGALSEGQVCYAMNTDRATTRNMKDELVKKGVDMWTVLMNEKEEADRG